MKRERQREREMSANFKELVHTVMRIKSEIFKAGWQARDPGKDWYCSLKSKGSMAAEFLPLGCDQINHFTPNQYAHMCVCVCLDRPDQNYTKLADHKILFISIV